MFSRQWQNQSGMNRQNRASAASRSLLSTTHTHAHAGTLPSFFGAGESERGQVGWEMGWEWEGSDGCSPRIAPLPGRQPRAHGLHRGGHSDKNQELIRASPSPISDPSMSCVSSFKELDTVRCFCRPSQLVLHVH